MIPNHGDLSHVMSRDNYLPEYFGRKSFFFNILSLSRDIQ